MPEIIDLSQPLGPTAFDGQPRLKRISHRRGAALLGLLAVVDRRPLKFLAQALAYLGGWRRLRAAHFPGGQGLAWELFSGDTHSGTHLDAPWHFGPRTGGRPARTVDEIPLQWCYGEGVALDLRAGRGPIAQGELEAALAAAGHALQPRDIVLLCTGAARHWESEDYPSRHRGLAPQALAWLAGRGIKVVAVDACTLDRPFAEMFEAYFADGDSGHLWPAHFEGRRCEICHIENAAHIESLLDRPTGFKVACFPVKVSRGSAGWVRLVALRPAPGELL